MSAQLRYTVECFQCRAFAPVADSEATGAGPADEQWHRITMGCGCTVTVQPEAAAAIELLASGTVDTAAVRHPDTDGNRVLRRGEVIN